MTDKKIRAILIEWLKIQHSPIRIYEEKVIGSSICDVMTATDTLSGYEIKSDVDDLRRLKNQAHQYSSIFSYCWLVVGETHLSHAMDTMPTFWGILCVREDNISVIREAKHIFNTVNHSLRLLWKPELKNLLLKNDMPLYAEKSTDYICHCLLEEVDHDVLERQIAEEIRTRDSDTFGSMDYSDYEYGRDGCLNGFPARELVDVLSQKDLGAFTLEKWIALYRYAKQVQEEKEIVFREPTVERKTFAIPYTDIEVRPGVPWISRTLINDFLIHITDARYSRKYVEYETVTGAWHICNKNHFDSAKSTVTFGLKHYNAAHILEATLNLREIKLYTHGTVYNERNTIAALEKQKQILEEFRSWLWQDEDRRYAVEKAYNELFGNFAVRQYDGSRLTFENMSPTFSLFDYQKDAVERILKTNNTLLAFDVGAGKTFIMIAAAMKMRQNGMSRKNLFVVPNHIVGQWEKMFTDLYPKAKVLAIEPKNFRPAMRYKILTQIKNGDYDGIIMAYSCFEMIPLSENTVLQNMSSRLQAIDSAVQSLRSHPYRWGCAPLEKEKSRIHKLVRDFLAEMDTQDSGGITFEDLEITSLFLDEAHNYKNMPLKTNLKNLSGINTKGSVKCLDMLHKVRYVQHTGRGVVFATGTPLCNSIADAYVMQLYLQPEELERTKLAVFDNWVKTFAQPEQLFEIDVNASRFRMIRKFAKFHNLPELSAMFSEVAIFHASAQDGTLPTLDGYTDVVIERFSALSAYMEKLCQRTEAIRSKDVDRSKDNMLKVSTDGRKAALCLTLVGEEQPEGKDSKLCRCIENVVSFLERYPMCTQLIFCDYSTPKAAQYNVYSDLKNRLIAAGVPKKEIAFIHDYKGELQKVELYRRFNAGEVRVLIGSTFKLGIGANVQTRLKAIHHLDVPWRPADMVQREGRLLRRGNENDKVAIFRYITEGSFDSYSWQLLETKQRFISQFLSGSTYQRSMEDLESSVLSYSEVKALALCEPRMRELAETENEIRSLYIIASKENDARQALNKEAAALKADLPRLKTRLAITNRCAEQLKRYTKADLTEASRSFCEHISQEMIDGTAPLPDTLTFLGFSLCAPSVQDDRKPYWCLCKDGESYAVEIGRSVTGNATRLIRNTLGHFDKIVENTQEAYDDAVSREREIATLLNNTATPYTDRLRQLEQKAAALKAELKDDE